MQQLQKQRMRMRSATAASLRPHPILSRPASSLSRARLATASASASAAPAPAPVSQEGGTAADQHAAFAAAVAGEWEGVTATFSPAGDALDLPERYVPSAFRDWDMVPKDWQTQCSVPPLPLSTASASASSGSSGAGAASSSSSAPPPLRYAMRRMMPTVGCEADAVAFTEDMTVIGGGADGDSSSSSSGAMTSAVLAAVAADGAYASAPAALPSDGRATVRLEACFPLPETSDKAGRPERLRVVQTLTRDWTARAEGEPPAAAAAGSASSSSSSSPSSSSSSAPPPAALLRLEGVELHREFREGPFTGRKELLGCGGGSPPISKLERTAREAAPSSAARAAVASASSSSPAALPPNAPPGSLAAPEGILNLLPLGAWSHVIRARGPGGAPVLRAEAGVVLGGGGGGGAEASAGPRRRRRVVVAFEFAADGSLSGVTRTEEEVA
jgi:hypothetical protein